MAFPLTAELPSRRPLGVWSLFLGLALLLHLLMFMLRVDWRGALAPPRVEIQQIDPAKLDAVRKQWADKKRSFVLDENKSLPKESGPVPEARYESDRNRRVKREQRARQADVIPRPAAPGSAAGSQARPAPPRPRSAPRVESLGQLGVPFHLAQLPAPAREAAPAETSARDSRFDPGAHQRLSDPALPEGGENLLNTQESVYYSFYARLYEAIGPLWQSAIRSTRPERKLEPGGYRTVVDVVLDRDGNLMAVRLLESSGVRTFDATVDGSWRRVKRFPNPPRGLLDGQGLIHMAWSFTVEVDKSMALNYLPPERDE
jgi:TonB family protein